MGPNPERFGRRPLAADQAPNFAGAVAPAPGRPAQRRDPFAGGLVPPPNFDRRAEFESFGIFQIQNRPDATAAGARFRRRENRWARPARSAAPDCKANPSFLRIQCESDPQKPVRRIFYRTTNPSGPFGLDFGNRKEDPSGPFDLDFGNHKGESDWGLVRLCTPPFDRGTSFRRLDLGLAGRSDRRKAAADAENHRDFLWTFGAAVAPLGLQPRIPKKFAFGGSPGAWPAHDFAWAARAAAEAEIEAEAGN